MAAQTIAATFVDNSGETRLNGSLVTAAAIPASQLGLTIRQAAGVPSGAPTTTELPIAADTTAVSGGLYVWSGAAWVKAATI